MNSTERLQQIFNNKPVKQKPRNIIYSNEMVKDLTDIIKYPINDIRFHLKMNEIEESIEMLSMSINNLCNTDDNNRLIITNLNNYSTEMAKFYYERSMETSAVEVILNINSRIEAFFKKIFMWIVGGFRRFKNFIRTLAAKRFILVYNKYKKNGKKYDPKVKMKSSILVKHNAFSLMQAKIKDLDIAISEISKVVIDNAPDKEKFGEGVEFKANKIFESIFPSRIKQYFTNSIKNSYGETMKFTAAEVFGSELNIELISPRFINDQLGTFTKSGEKFLKMLEKASKLYHTDKIEKAVSEEEKKEYKMFYKNTVYYLQHISYSFTIMISTIITVCKTIAGALTIAMRGPDAQTTPEAAAYSDDAGANDPNKTPEQNAYTRIINGVNRITKTGSEMEDLFNFLQPFIDSNLSALSTALPSIYKKVEYHRKDWTSPNSGKTYENNNTISYYKTIFMSMKRNGLTEEDCEFLRNLGKTLTDNGNNLQSSTSSDIPRPAEAKVDSNQISQQNFAKIMSNSIQMMKDSSKTKEDMFRYIEPYIESDILAISAALPILFKKAKQYRPDWTVENRGRKMSVEKSTIGDFRAIFNIMKSSGLSEEDCIFLRKLGQKIYLAQSKSTNTN